jgi:membrane-bound serine protease (ClpP class)
MFLLLLALAAALLLVAGALVLAALSRHKKSGTGPLALIGATGRALDELAPAGTVLVNGEIWPARAETPLPAQTRVRVVSAAGHWLVVARADDSL